ncbi:MAG: tetratricopeptide repeat protein [Bacteroidetes bacterium]|nr:tetratricopeptide repeat protein [Bacteroidota bacterium]
MPLKAQGQHKLDSLLTLLEHENYDTAKVKLYQGIAKIYLKINLDSSLHYSDKGLDLARKIGFEKGEGDIYMVMGHIKVVQNDLFNALKYYQNAANLFHLANDAEGISAAYLLLGNVYFTLSNYPDALDYYQKGVVIADSNNSIAILPDFYNNLAVLNELLKNYNEAIEYLNKSLQLREDLKDQKGSAGILINLSKIYLKLDESGIANDYLDRAYKLCLELRDNEGLYNIYNVYADIAKRENNYSKAIEYYKQGSKYLESIGSEFLGPISSMKSDLFTKMGYSYLENQDYKSAEEYLLKGYTLSGLTGQLELLMSASDYLSRLYEETGQPVKALRFAKEFKTYSDSLSKNENIKKITQLEMQFAFDEQLREREIEQARLDAKQKRKELIYIMISGSIFLALIILFLLFRLQKLKMKRISLEKTNLKNDLDYKNKELTTNVMYLLKKNEFIINISDKLKKSRYDFKPENRKIVDDIIRELESSSTKDTWKDFEMRFQEVHADFYQKLIKQFPDLSPNELKLCAFLRLNMSTKEISTITFQSPKSISMARFRLRKKMGVGNYDNLISYLNQI